MARVAPVPRPVRRELLPPERAAARRLAAVRRTAVPETAVHEDREPARPEDEVRPRAERAARAVPPAHDLLAPPARDALRPEHARQRALRRGVAPGPDPRHQRAALRPRVDVRHGLITKIGRGRRASPGRTGDSPNGKGPTCVGPGMKRFPAGKGPAARVTRRAGRRRGVRGRSRCCPARGRCRGRP